IISDKVLDPAGKSTDETMARLEGQITGSVDRRDVGRRASRDSVCNTSGEFGAKHSPNRVDCASGFERSYARLRPTGRNAKRSDFNARSDQAALPSITTPCSTSATMRSSV